MNTIELNYSRRSVNFFDANRVLPDKLIKVVINEASYAPSAYNLQPFRLIQVSSKDAKELLYNAAYKQQKILEAPVTFIVVSNLYAFQRENPAWDESFETNGEESTLKAIQSATKFYGKDDISRVKFAESNSSLFAMNLMILFKAHNVDTHPMSGMDIKKIKEGFNISKNEDVVMLISAGYFDRKQALYTRKKRKTTEMLLSKV
ncbi:hypothetical protein CI105_03830 [Candidatus Izimaplasma bacterium ZiA1]|uniref:nitroreductase family protein n=1 Tax=Candidatus Izimoplasma sp. ZiA1 TaxID=2024899 RepID=UPI000BAA617A|nr:hypothetical protein CI105_03830 [Candidatus Izimaplasma bacterium ZiA1]